MMKTDDEKNSKTLLVKITNLGSKVLDGSILLLMYFVALVAFFSPVLAGLYELYLKR